MNHILDIKFDLNTLTYIINGYGFTEECLYDMRDMLIKSRVIPPDAHIFEVAAYIIRSADTNEGLFSEKDGVRIQSELIKRTLLNDVTEDFYATTVKSKMVGDSKQIMITRTYLDLK